MKTPVTILFILLVVHSHAKTYYFSNSFGNDTHTATQAQNPATPWQTIDIGFTNFMNGSSPNTFLGGDSILFARGETFYTSIGMILKRSGGSGNPIFIGAYGVGARPVITSLVSFTWTQTGITNSCNTGIVGNLWRSNEQITTLDSLNLVTKNNLPIEMGRWPQSTAANGGWNSIANAVSSTSFIQLTGSELTGQPCYVFGAEVVYKATRYWINRERISAYSAGTHTITFQYQRDKLDAPPLDPSGGRYWGYFIQDDSTTLTYQNAWWFKKNKYLKMYSVGAPTGISAASTDNLVYSNTIGFIDIDSLNFNGCNADAISLNAGNSINVTHCIIQNAGRNGIKHSTDNCDFLYDSVVNCLSDGIHFSMGSDFTTIRYCTIRNMGQLIGHGTGNIEDTHGNHSGVGIYIGTDHVDNQIVEYNTIVNCGYTGIHFKRNSNVTIRYNYIDTVCNVTDDGGGIYSFSGDGKSTSINSNVKTIHNIVLHGIGAPYGWPQTGDPNAGVKGIYHDEWTNHDVTDSNTVAFFEDGIFANNGCNNNFIRNNTFYGNTSSGIHFNSRSSDHTRKITATDNIVYALTSSDYGIILHQYADPAAFDSFGTIDRNKYLRPLSANGNLFRYETQTSPSSTSSTNTTLTGWQAVMKYDDHSSLTPYTFANTTNQGDSTIFRFNATAAAVTSSLAGTWQDIYGTSYTNNVTIPAFDAKVLFKVTDVFLLTPPTNQIIKSRRKFKTIPLE